MRRQITWILFSLLYLALPAWAVDRGALFKVESKGHTLYLFGTMHVGLPEFYPLEQRIAEAVAHAPTLALEIDPLQDPSRLAAAMKEHGLFAPGSAGYGAMPAPAKAKLDRVLAKRGIDPATVAPFKPWLLATVLAVSEYAVQGYRADLAVDAHLAALARANKVPVMELESLSSQLGIFSRLSEADQWNFLQECVDAIDSGKQSSEVRAIVEAWRSADQAALDAIALQAESDTSVSGKFVQQRLLDERNGPMADKLVQLLAQKNNSVAAIGVLHLLGKNSVPQLLRARGVSVERVY